MEHTPLVIFCILGLLLLFRIMAAPIRLLWKAVLNTLCGFSALLLFNLLGAAAGITLGFNPITWFTVAFLGLPGVGLLLILRAVTYL